MTNAEIGGRLEQAARTIAPLLAAAYVAGYCVGAWLHRLNDRLARLWLVVLGLIHQQQDPVAEDHLIDGNPHEVEEHLSHQHPASAKDVFSDGTPHVDVVRQHHALMRSPSTTRSTTRSTTPPAPLPSTVVGLRALARQRGIPSRQWKSARKAVLLELLA